MFPLPPNLTRHFRGPSGKLDYRAVLRAPDAQLVELARDMEPGERVELYHRLRRFRLGFFEGIAASAAGVDVETQRRRFLRILEEAHVEAAAAVS
ncbi:MAG: hypothetical protein K2X82_05330 [Gemmataceae bacterium]|nr:hypothetical protein [Gemmataceae bacterium]